MLSLRPHHFIKLLILTLAVTHLTSGTSFSISDKRYVEIAVDSLIANYQAKEGEINLQDTWSMLSDKYNHKELEEYAEYSLQVESEPALKQHLFGSMMYLLEKRGYVSKLEYSSYGSYVKIYGKQAE